MRGFASRFGAEAWVAAIAALGILLGGTLFGDDRLISGTERVADLQEGQRRLYRLDLRADELWQLSFRSDRGSFRVRIFDDLGRRQVDLETLPISGGTERLAGWERQTARYSLEVTSLGPKGGRLQILLEARSKESLQGQLRLLGTAATKAAMDLSRGGDTRGASNRFLQAANFWWHSGDPEQEAIAELRAARESPRQALYILPHTFEVYRSLHSKPGEAAVLRAFGEALQSLKEPQRAATFWRQAGEAFYKANDRTAAAECYIAEGHIHHLAADYQSAKECYQKAQLLRSSIGDPAGGAQASYMLANLALSLADAGETRRLIEEARKNLESPRGPLLQLEAMLLMQLRDYPGADRAIQESLDLYLRQEGPLDFSSLAYSHNLRGNLFVRQERFREAEASYREALRLVSLGGDSSQTVYIQGNLGKGLLRAHQDREAVELFEQVLVTLRESHNRPYQVVALLDLASAQLALGEVSQATENQRLARDLVEKLRISSDSEASRLETLALLQQLYDVLIGVAWSNNNKSCAFEAAEASHARVLLDDWAAANEPVSPIDPSRLRCLDKEPKDSMLEIRRTLLDDRTALLVFNLAERNTYYWWIDRTNESLSDKLPVGREQIDGWVEDLRKAWAKPPDSENRKNVPAKAAVELSRILLGPVAERLHGIDRLLIVADGDLQYIPFAALPVPGSESESLIDRVEVVSIPSVTAYARLRQKEATQARPKGAVIFANPKFALDGSRPLPETQKEGEAIRDLFPPGEAQLLTGADATVEKYIGIDLRHVGLLQLATHGNLNRENPQASSLQFAEVDERGLPLSRTALYPADIVKQPLTADLVVLSACETGLNSTEGEGMTGLPRAFLAAGAKRVVTTLWRVGDDDAQELMIRFHQGIKSGLPISKALREAQRAIRNLEGRSAPYHWAGYVLYGLP
jgi:CHAT domain-containing protein